MLIAASASTALVPEPPDSLLLLLSIVMKFLESFTVWGFMRVLLGFPGQWVNSSGKQFWTIVLDNSSVQNLSSSRTGCQSVSVSVFT